MSEPNIMKWTLRKMLWITLSFSCAIFFITDPYNWIPEPDTSPCKKGDIRTKCTGRIIFFWQKP